MNIIYREDNANLIVEVDGYEAFRISESLKCDVDLDKVESMASHTYYEGFMLEETYRPPIYHKGDFQ